MEHLDDNAASEFVSGALPPSAVGKVEGHLASCRECRALVAALAADPGTDSAAVTFRRDGLGRSGPVGELPRASLTAGDRVGRYIVLSTIGVGGMGVVFIAHDPQLGRRVALKLLRSALAVSSKDARTRLRREAQAIAQLSHPNVVSIYDVGTTDDGALYIAMEFVEGDTLTSWLRNYPRDWREILDVFRQAARGLYAAHGVGLLHRDFKPDNVLVGGDGRVRVTDFGLARSVLVPEETSPAKPVVTALDAALTVTGTVLGTPRYMPPEQLTGPEIDARSDQFSFCVALYEALYDRHPLRGGTSVSMLDHGDRAAAPPDGTRVPAAIGRAVLRGLERDRARRFPSMSELIDALEVRPRRSPVRFAAFASAGVFLIGGTTAALVLRQQQMPVTQPLDFTTIDDLARERDRYRDEAGDLRVQLQNARAENDQLKVTVKDRTDEVARVTDALVQLQATTEATRARLTEAMKKLSRMLGATATINSDALDAALFPVQGCFSEWHERNRVDATLVVRFTVSPAGNASAPRIVSTPDQHARMQDDEIAPGLSLLEMCVSEQIGRVKFPAATEELEVEVTALWSQGRVSLIPSVVGHRAVSRRRIDLP